MEKNKGYIKIFLTKRNKNHKKVVNERETNSYAVVKKF
jgi:hypothetical protein